MRIAFVTSDGERVEGELRRAPRIVVFEVTAAAVTLAGSTCFGAAHRSQDRIAALAGAEVVYVAAIGPSMAARLVARGIRPAIARPGRSICALLAAHQLAARDPAPLDHAWAG
jgi:predicted Fe-Mo cluster-binding NifX family protein